MFKYDFPMCLSVCLLIASSRDYVAQSEALSGSPQLDSLVHAFRDAVQDMSGQGTSAGLDVRTIAVIMAKEADRLVTMVD